MDIQQQYLFAKEHILLLENIKEEQKKELFHMAADEKEKQKWLASLFGEKLILLKEFVSLCEDQGIHLTIKKAD